jgi:hypothetical protein
LRHAQRISPSLGGLPKKRLRFSHQDEFSW